MTATEAIKEPAIRPIDPGDMPGFHASMRGFAEYCRLGHGFEATGDMLAKHLLGGPDQRAEAVVAEVDGEVVGFAVFYHNFSTFLGIPGIFLLDLYVSPGFRGAGIGGRLMGRVAAITLERGCGRLEWHCQDHNTGGQAFYRSLGARHMREWIPFRLEGEALVRMAQGDGPMEDVGFRVAGPADVPLVLSFIRELAGYEELLHEVEATPETLMDSMFRRRRAEAIIAEHRGEPMGFALYFRTFSTFVGRPGIYLEDLFVRPSARGLGIGKALLARLAGMAVSEGGCRVDWGCLDWNAPSIAFYRSIGAYPMEDTMIFRLTGEPLERLASR